MPRERGYLTTTAPSTVLSAFLKSRIQIRPHNPLVQFRPIDESHAIDRLLVSLVLDETESARSFLETIEAHDNSFHLATSSSQKTVSLEAGHLEKSSCICSSVV
jgi:hypothetical protein